ncbi:helicase-related protein [Niallia sp. 01092]|uniref:helicase-related protein n=1 Tax=unclassified Niallia TaxID=2837522 RepID=UPI003FD3318A
MSDILSGYYYKAVERTKEMILEDIDKYLQGKKEMPSYEQYLREREEYINQIWLNTWLNSAASHASFEEKKKYLTHKGLSIEGENRKLINKLFRNEIREIKPYDYHDWLDSLFANQKSAWEIRYIKAREAYLDQQKKEKQRDIRTKLDRKFQYYIKQILDEDYEYLYLYVRYLIGSHLAIEIERKGITLSSEELTFDEYLYDEMELPDNKFLFLEDLTETYEAIILQYLFDFGPNWLKQTLPAHLYEEYEKVFQKALTDSYLKEVGMDLFEDSSLEFFEDLLEENIADLMKLIDIPFDLETHQEIYEKDRLKRQQKEIADREERKRRKEEEARMIDDIFGREYNPPSGRNIHYVLHVGETNTGKTFQAIKRMKEANSGLYLAPLRLLALEVYEKLNADNVLCSLKTGEEEKLIMGANHLSCTVEMFHEKDFYEVIVIDESQMIADKDRGFAWYRAITKANAKEVHIICSFHAKSMILQLLGESYVEVHEYVRETPLEVDSQLFRFNQTRKGDALVCFSRRRVLETASELQRTGRQVSLIYGSMPPETRKKQMQRFLKGETSVIVSTDAIGMGLNLPIRRIVFLENDKFDGTKRRWLTSQEVKQIAGRAGRRGLYDVGRVAFTSDPKKMTQLLEQKDEELTGFAIAPTSAVLERFQKYANNLGLFFHLWDRFKSPEGTKKATLSEEKILYEMIEDTMVEARLSVNDLFGFLRLPFATSEPALRAQWKLKMEALVENKELPDPLIKESSLEDMELSYKSVGVHLLFLYKLGKRTEAHYWERVRDDISSKIHEHLKAGIPTRKKVCRICGESLPTRFKYQVCNDCYFVGKK